MVKYVFIEILLRDLLGGKTMFVKNACKRRELVLHDLHQYAHTLGDEHLINLVDDVIEQFRDTKDRIILEAVHGDVDDTIPMNRNTSYKTVYTFKDDNDNIGDFRLYYGEPTSDDLKYYLVPRDYTFLEDYYG